MIMGGGLNCVVEVDGVEALDLSSKSIRETNSRVSRYDFVTGMNAAEN